MPTVHHRRNIVDVVSLQVGHELAHYKILEPIGKGGMGEVFRARDGKLGRDVAIKILPEEFARDTERLDRLTREARLLAQLNHANIATLHALEEHDARMFIVMELVEGETLAERMARGRIPVDEAVPLFIQIAEGLEAAHEKGIIHRDLKPANIKIGPDGKPKILDFGLAKGYVGADESAPDSSQSPTQAKGTAHGVILGTVAYMSPEQARGKSVDKRTDIWAYGCVLFEALSGDTPFEGETVTDLLAAIVHMEPRWSSLPGDLPASIRGLLRHCLSKNVAHRLRDIGDARLAIEDPIAESEPDHPLDVTTSGRRRAGLVVAMLLASALTALLMWLLRPAAPDSPPLRFSHWLPPGLEFPTDVYSAGLALARDGSRIAYVARELESGDTHLYLLELKEFLATRLPGTEGASSPFFSPDGSWIAFFADERLKKVSIQGAPLVDLSEASRGGGGTWTEDDVIYFSQAMAGGVRRVAADGGPVESATKLEVDEMTHLFPVAVSGSKAILVTAHDKVEDTRVFVLKPASGERRLLVEMADTPAISPSGHLLYAHSGRLMAMEFDAQRQQTEGTPVPILEGIQTRQWGSETFYRLSESGVLVYVPGLGYRPPRRLNWVEPGGKHEPSSKNVEPYIDPSLSPDGRRLAVAISGEGLQQVWSLDLARDTLTRLTFVDGRSAYAPIWTSDGLRITYTTFEEILSIAADGSGALEALFQTDLSHESIFPTSWKPNDEALAYTKFTEGNRSDVWLYDPETDPPKRPLLATSADEGQAVFSPDGRWLAYISDESGRHEVYVQAFPGPGNKWRISTDGGIQPRWARDGRELYYVERTHMMSVSIETRPEFAPGQPREIFDGYWASEGVVANYDVAPDGRFLIIEATPEEVSRREIRVVVNWLQELAQLVPTDQ